MRKPAGGPLTSNIVARGNQPAPDARRTCTPEPSGAPQATVTDQCSGQLLVAVDGSYGESHQHPAYELPQPSRPPAWAISQRGPAARDQLALRPRSCQKRERQSFCEMIDHQCDGRRVPDCSRLARWDGQVLARAPCGDVAIFSSIPGVAPERRYEPSTRGLGAINSRVGPGTATRQRRATLCAPGCAVRRAGTYFAPPLSLETYSQSATTTVTLSGPPAASAARINAWAALLMSRAPPRRWAIS